MTNACQRSEVEWNVGFAPDCVEKVEARIFVHGSEAIETRWHSPESIAYAGSIRSLQIIPSAEKPVFSTQSNQKEDGMHKMMMAAVLSGLAVSAQAFDPGCMGREEPTRQSRRE